MEQPAGETRVKVGGQKIRVELHKLCGEVTRPSRDKLLVEIQGNLVTAMSPFSALLWLSPQTTISHVLLVNLLTQLGEQMKFANLYDPSIDDDSVSGYVHALGGLREGSPASFLFDVRATLRDYVLHSLDTIRIDLRVEINHSGHDPAVT